MSLKHEACWVSPGGVKAMKILKLIGNALDVMFWVSIVSFGLLVLYLACRDSGPTSLPDQVFDTTGGTVRCVSGCPRL